MNHFIPRWPHERIFAYVVVSIPCLCMCSPSPRTPQHEHIAAWALSRVSIFMYMCINIRCEMMEKEKAWARKLIHYAPRGPVRCPRRMRRAVTVTLGSFRTRKMAHPPPCVAAQIPPLLPPASLGINNRSNHLGLTLPRSNQSRCTLGPLGEIANQKQSSVEGPSFSVCSVASGEL